MQDARYMNQADLLRAVVPLAPSSSGVGDTLGREAPWGADVGRPWVPLGTWELNGIPSSAMLLAACSASSPF